MDTAWSILPGHIGGEEEVTFSNKTNNTPAGVSTEDETERNFAWLSLREPGSGCLAVAKGEAYTCFNIFKFLMFLIYAQFSMFSTVKLLTCLLFSMQVAKL